MTKIIFHQLIKSLTFEAVFVFVHSLSHQTSDAIKSSVFHRACFSDGVWRDDRSEGVCIESQAMNWRLYSTSKHNTKHSTRKKVLINLMKKWWMWSHSSLLLCFCKSCENSFGGFAAVILWYSCGIKQFIYQNIKYPNPPPVKLLNAAFACMLFLPRFMSITLGRSSLLRWMVLWAFPREIVYALCLHKDSTPDERWRMRRGEELS